VEVQVTALIRSAFGLVLDNHAGVTTDEFVKLRAYNLDSVKTIPFSVLQTISKSLQELRSANKVSDGTPVWMHELIRGSKIIVPSIPEKIQTPEQIEKRKRLQAYVENMRYEKMTRNVSMTDEQEKFQEKSEMADFQSQLGMGMNIVFSIAVALIIGYYVGSRIFHSYLGGLAVGLLLMIGALVVETVIFTIRLNRVDERKEREDKKLQERRKHQQLHGGYNMTPHLLALANPDRNKKLIHAIEQENNTNNESSNNKDDDNNNKEINNHEEIVDTESNKKKSTAKVNKRNKKTKR